MMRALKNTQKLGFETFTKRSLFMIWETYCFSATVSALTAGHTRGKNNKKVAEY